MSNQDDAASEFPHLPRNMRALIKYIGFPNFDRMPDDEKEIYDLARNGHCMTCKGSLGENANFIVNKFGIVGAYCSGVCHSDMAILGFLQQTHDDITSQVRFRGSQTPQADPIEVPDTLTDDAAFKDVDPGEVENDKDARQVDESDS